MGSSATRSVMTQMDGMGVEVRRRFKREWIYVYVQLIHFAVPHKLTQYGKATIH